MVIWNTVNFLHKDTTKSYTLLRIFEGWLQSVLEEFYDQVIDLDAESDQLWGVLQASGPQHTLDKQIAATALIHGLAVVTRNENDFANTGVTVLNPWT